MQEGGTFWQILSHVQEDRFSISIVGAVVVEGKPQASGRVYAMLGAEAGGSSNLVISNCLLYGRCFSVLYDSGATHFFVSDACV